MIPSLDLLKVIRDRKVARDEIKEKAARGKLEKEKKAVEDVADRVRVGMATCFCRR